LPAALLAAALVAVGPREPVVPVRVPRALALARVVLVVRAPLPVSAQAPRGPVVLVRVLVAVAQVAEAQVAVSVQLLPSRSFSAATARTTPSSTGAPTFERAPRSR
jgi:hypothetical protein